MRTLEVEISWTHLIKPHLPYPETMSRLQKYRKIIVLKNPVLYSAAKNEELLKAVWDYA